MCPSSSHLTPCGSESASPATHLERLTPAMANLPSSLQSTFQTAGIWCIAKTLVSQSAVWVRWHARHKCSNLHG